MAYDAMLSRRQCAAFASALPLLARIAPARAESSFATFLAGVRAEARGLGVSSATLDQAFTGLQPNAKVLELDSHQPELTLTWERYRTTRLSEPRVAAGRQAWQQNAAVLRDVASRYGVDSGVIVGIWGLESNYGGYMGGFSVVEALATLAWDGRHNGFFRAELIDALRILDHGDITLPRMVGSYAGAMGQPQFMPSAYLNYAVDYRGTGRRDIWNDRGDVLASIANYLSKFGWRAEEPWGQLVRIPPGFDADLTGRNAVRPLADWLRLGVAAADGARFARPELAGAVIMPDGPGGEAYMLYANFGVIRRYNPSDFYALSVGLLGDRVSA